MIAFLSELIKTRPYYKKHNVNDQNNLLPCFNRIRHPLTAWILSNRIAIFVGVNLVYVTF